MNHSNTKGGIRRSLRLPPSLMKMMSPRKKNEQTHDSFVVVGFSGISPSKEDEQVSALLARVIMITIKQKFKVRLVGSQRRHYLWQFYLTLNSNLPALFAVYLW